MLTPSHVETVLSRHPASKVYWIAYSGGLDSTVLLHLCAALRNTGPAPLFKALHVHHGLHPQANEWVDHCAVECLTVGIELHTYRVDARPTPGQSPEEAARKARYRAIQHQIGPGDTVLLAQHQDDQAETLLLQLFRGAGLAGLAAMPEHAPLAPGYALRPLLDIPRAALRDYAARHGLVWIEDPSNQDPAFDRNFLRHTLLPAIKTHWPGISRVLSRTARHCAEAVGELNVRAAELLRAARGSANHTLYTGVLRNLPPTEQKLLLRGWLKESDYRMPSAAILDDILKQCLGAGISRNPVVRWPEGEVRRYRDQLYLLPAQPPWAAGGPVDWPECMERLMLPNGNGVLTTARVPDGGISLARWQNATRCIRYRQGGETLRLPGRAGHHELRKLFQEAGIPPWIRGRIPLIYLDNQLAAVGGYWLAADAVIPQGLGPGLVPVWLPPPGVLISCEI